MARLRNELVENLAQFGREMRRLRLVVFSDFCCVQMLLQRVDLTGSIFTGGILHLGLFSCIRRYPFDGLRPYQRGLARYYTRTAILGPSVSRGP